MTPEEYKELQEKQQKIYNDFKTEVRAEIDGLKTSPEREAKFEKMEKDFADIEKKMQEHQAELEQAKTDKEAMEKKLKDLEAKTNRPSDGAKLPVLDRKDFICEGLYQGAIADGSEEKMAAFWKALKGTEPLDAEERKALTFADPTTGGYLGVPEYVTNEIIKEMRVITPVLQIAKVRTTSANQIVFPKKTGTVTAVRRGESESKSETTGLTYGAEAITLPEMYTYMDISEMDLEDTMFNMEAEIKEESKDAFAAKLGDEFVNGVGPLQLEGLLTNADIGSVVGGSATAFAYGTLVDFVEGTLKAQHRPNAKLMFNLANLAKLRQVKDNATYGDSIWAPGFAATPNTIMGKPYILSEDMPDISDGAYPIFYGDFKKAYQVGLRVAMSMKKIVDSTLDAAGNVRFSARMRVGGKVVLAAALKKYKTATS